MRGPGWIQAVFVLTFHHYRCCGVFLLDAGLLLQEYDAFVKRHPEVLETTKVPAEDTRAKARVLALLSLASQHNELGFAAIKVG